MAQRWVILVNSMLHRVQASMLGDCNFDLNGTINNKCGKLSPFTTMPYFPANSQEEW
jgi:hypothetical protein